MQKKLPLFVVLASALALTIPFAAASAKPTLKCKTGYHKVKRNNRSVCVRNKQAPPPTQGIRSNPWPLGTVVADKNWSVRINSTDWDAWSDGVIPNANEFNVAPPAGWQDVMVNMTVTYVGAGSGNLGFEFDINTGTLGASNILYQSFDLAHDCGVLPSPSDLDFSTLYSGATVTFNECWQVQQGDISSLEFVYTPWINGFFALR